MYLGNIRIGAQSAAKARQDYTATSRRQQELQYHAARAVAGMDVQKLAAGGGLPDEVLSFLDGEGIMPSDEVIARTLDQLDAQTKAYEEAHGTLMHAIRADNGIYTDFRNGTTPVFDPRMTLNDSKKALNYDNPLHPIMRKAIQKLAQEKSLGALIQRTNNKWDFDAYKATIANAHKTEIQNPDGSVTPYTDQMREDDFLRTAATQMGLNMESSIRGVRTAMEPGDGAKFARTKRYAGKKLDRWRAFVPNAREIDLSNRTAVAQRIIDYGQFHRLDPKAMDESLEILLGDGNMQQLSRHALEDSLNKTNDAIIDGFQTGGRSPIKFTREEMDSLKSLVRRRTSYSLFTRDNEARQTYTETVTIGGQRTWQMSDEAGNPIERPPISHLYLNEQVNNFLSMPSTTDLIGLQRKFLFWKEMIARTKDENGGKMSQLGATGKALDYLYLNTYRTMLLLRPAYIMRNLLEMDVRSFLSNSNVSLFAHPVTALYAAIGQISPAGSPLVKRQPKAWLKLKETFGMYDQTPLGKDYGDYGDDAAEFYTRNVFQIEHRRRSIVTSGSVDNEAMVHHDYKPVAITNVYRWKRSCPRTVRAAHQRSGADGRTGWTDRSAVGVPERPPEAHRQAGVDSSEVGRDGHDHVPGRCPHARGALRPEGSYAVSERVLQDQQGVPGGQEGGCGRPQRISHRADLSAPGQHPCQRAGGRGWGSPHQRPGHQHSGEHAQHDAARSGGYLERIHERTFGGDQRLKDYIAHGGFHPEGHPIGQAIPDQVV